jgi:hypothetical protein
MRIHHEYKFAIGFAEQEILDRCTREAVVRDVPVINENLSPRCLSQYASSEFLPDSNQRPQYLWRAVD